MEIRVWDSEGSFFHPTETPKMSYGIDVLRFLTSLIADPHITIMEFTGLRDKSGVKIFEGDLLKIIDPLTDCATIKTVCFEDGCFVVKIDNDYTPCLCEFVNREVVGNIFENPELLERV